MDGLGGLTHSDAKAGNTQRFGHYIEEFFPDAYRANMSLLWDLRNSLAQNALNVAAFVSYAPASEEYHLVRSRNRETLYTPYLVRDFRQSLEKLKQRLLKDSTLAQRAEQMLTIQDIHESDYRRVETTPRPLVKMIKQK